MKIAVCRLCGVPHRSSDPHVFDMKPAEPVDSVQPPPLRGASQLKTRGEIRHNSVSLAEFNALKAELSALRDEVAALRSNVTSSLRDVTPMARGDSTNAERQRRYRERKRVAAS